MTKGDIELIDDQTAKDLGLRKPSAELIQLIKECGKIGTKLSGVFERMKEKAKEEGFTDQETISLFKIYLRGALTPNQIRWYLIEKEKRNLKKQLEIKDDKNKNIQIRSKVQVQEAEIITDTDHKTKTIELDNAEVESIQDLRATVDTQQQYISTLEEKVQEKQEVTQQQNQIRVKISVSQLYRDVLMMRNSNAIYTNILIDNNKYVKLEPV